MTLQLSPDRRDQLNALLDRVIEHARAARYAETLDGSKAALNEVWFAVHDAQDAIIRFDLATRRDAEAENERRHAERLAELGA
jgi:hypothetical protein